MNSIILCHRKFPLDMTCGKYLGVFSCLALCVRMGVQVTCVLEAGMVMEWKIQSMPNPYTMCLISKFSDEE